ncbi:MAG: hypothetical protein K2X52_09015 [Mycobacteriaceae bacterium]|nr:hypothetical protein [Mycobacteriaceae bacterium]
MKRVQVVGSLNQESISSIDSVASLRRIWNNHVELAVLGQRAAELIGVPEDEGVTTDLGSNIEIARMFGVPLAKTFTSLQELADTAVVPQGGSRDAFWTTVLSPIAAMSTAVTVLDSYLFGELWWRGVSSRVAHPEHLIWLLEKLDETMRPRSEVELIASIDPSRRNAHTLEATAELIRDFWRRRPPGRIARVRLVGSSNSRDFPHDRHIRFNTGIAITFDAGLDRLRRQTVEDPNGMAWGHKWHRQAIETLKEREQRARKLPGVTIRDVF